ncbi:hypothetical protein [Hydrogenovibrio marinus]|nr:hypothetical protein [Hydrogenovibrio marinus]
MDNWNNPEAFSDIETRNSTPRPQILNEIISGIYIPFDWYKTNYEGKPALVLKLYGKTSNEEVELFFNNFTLSKNKKNYKTERTKSKFACTYRLCFGMVNNDRFSKSEQLIQHFVDIQPELNCKAKIQFRAKNHDSFYCVKEFNPCSPVYDDAYSKRGVLINRKRGAYNSQPGKKLENIRKEAGKHQERSWKEKQTSNPHKNLVSNNISSTNYLLIANEVLANNASLSNKEYMVRNESGGFDFIQMPNETMDELFDRVLDTTW